MQPVHLNQPSRLATALTIFGLVVLTLIVVIAVIPFGHGATPQQAPSATGPIAAAAQPHALPTHVPRRYYCCGGFEIDANGRVLGFARADRALEPNPQGCSCPLTWLDYADGGASRIATSTRAQRFFEQKLARLEADELHASAVLAKSVAHEKLLRFYAHA